MRSASSGVARSAALLLAASALCSSACQPTQSGMEAPLDRYRRQIDAAFSRACVAPRNCAQGDFTWIGGESHLQEGKGALHVSWRKELTPSERGRYRPVENAVAAIDAQHNRIYVGAESGRLWALGFDGTPLYHFELHEPIECEPALDAEKDELYVTTERNELYALTPSSGAIRWKVETHANVRKRPILFQDALYVVTEDDSVEARSRSDGSVLWSFKRERSEGFLVAGHAGLSEVQGGVLYAAFNDGSVVALDALDGSAKWVRETSIDVPEAEPGRPRYVDADTTPVRIGEHVYAASFAGGLYCLDANNGSVVWREAEWTGITGIAPGPEGSLLLVSADRGVVRLELATRTALWEKSLERGSFGTPQLAAELLLVGDSRGSLVALYSETGEEVGRIDAGHGFSARAAIDQHRGFIITNGGTLLALHVATH
jgi:outer membrane protein assembly factor BamB